MKKILLIMLSVLIFTPGVFAEEIIEEKLSATLIKCDKSDSIFVEVGGETKIITLIAYDKGDGTLNKEIDNYVCEKLSSGSITLEYDSVSLDKYNRLPVWVYIDGKLLQEELISKGYGQVNYVLGNYKYLDNLCEVQKDPIRKGVGIWKYEGIKEEYCNSGIEIGSNEKEEKKESKISKDKLHDTLRYMLFLSSGMLLLVLLLVRGKTNG